MNKAFVCEENSGDLLRCRKNKLVFIKIVFLCFYSMQRILWVMGINLSVELLQIRLFLKKNDVLCQLEYMVATKK